MRKFSSLRKRLGTVSMEYVIILGTSIVMAGLATGTAISSMQYQAAADLTAAAMTADFTQAAAEHAAASNVAEFNNTGQAVWGTQFVSITPTATTNNTVENAALTIGPTQGAPILGTLVIP